MVIYSYKDCKEDMATWKHYIEFTMILAGTLATRCWAMVIAVTLYLIHCRSLCFVLRFRGCFYLLGFGYVINKWLTLSCNSFFFCLLNRFLCIVNHNFLRLQYDAHAEHTNVLDTTFKFRTDYEIIKNNTYDFMTFVQEN